jgi:hypothetical protein
MKYVIHDAGMERKTYNPISFVFLHCVGKIVHNLSFLAIAIIFSNLASN